jgi:hypothetical protein
MKEKILTIAAEIADMYPYKVRGDYDSYSQYNEGWSDACDILTHAIIEKLFD